MPFASSIKILKREVKLYGGADWTFLQYRRLGEADGSGVFQEFFENSNQKSSRIPIKILSEFRLEKHKKVQKYLMLTLEEGLFFIGIK